MPAGKRVVEKVEVARGGRESKMPLSPPPPSDHHHRLLSYAAVPAPFSTGAIISIRRLACQGIFQNL